MMTRLQKVIKQDSGWIAEKTGFAILSSLPAAVTGEKVQIPDFRETPEDNLRLLAGASMMPHSFDCIIAGAGTAGVTAAIQCGRAGLRTLLLERSGQPGGTMTSSLIAFPGLFFAWGKQIIAGIGWELTRKCVALAGGTMPHFEEQKDLFRHDRYQVRLNSALFAAICDEELAKAGVRCFYHTLPVGATPAKDGWEITVATQDGEEKFTSRILIDCTGDASLTALAGYERIFPDPLQPATFSYKLSGYNPADLDMASIARAADAAVANGTLKYTDLSWSTNSFRSQILNSFGNNGNHIFLQTAANAEARSQLEQEGRSTMLRAFRFLKMQPGLENLTIDFASPECGIRESAVIAGEHTVTGEEYCTGMRYPDSVAFTIYPIDLHQKEGGVNTIPLQNGVLPTIPLRAMIPAHSKYFLAAGRCISSDRAANSALRVQASCMAMGQAAGAAAVLSVQNGITPGAVDIVNLKQFLREAGAIVPGDETDKNTDGEFLSGSQKRPDR